MTYILNSKILKTITTIILLFLLLIFLPKENLHNIFIEATSCIIYSIISFLSDKTAECMPADEGAIIKDEQLGDQVKKASDIVSGKLADAALEGAVAGAATHLTASYITEFYKNPTSPKSPHIEETIGAAAGLAVGSMVIKSFELMKQTGESILKEEEIKEEEKKE